jgi:hypothetical protein
MPLMCKCYLSYFKIIFRTIRKGETKTLKFNVSELTIMIYAGKLTDYPKINGSYPSRNKVYGT